MRAAWVLVVAAIAVGLAAATISGPSPTAPQRPTKPPEGPEMAAVFVADDVDWRSWTDDEAVDRLVLAPYKWLAPDASSAENRALKSLTQRAEEQVRAILREVAAGSLDAGEAGAQLEAMSREYLAALDGLAAAR